MSGSYRLQPPSPFPYSGGSRMEQALVPALQGSNGNAMLGYVLGAQLQRQADLMNYEGAMNEYNLTAQQEGEQARQEAAALRREQMQHNLTAAAVNSGGPGFLPESYTLTPQQRELAGQDAQARIALRTAQAERANRTGTGTGSATRVDPLVAREYGSLLTEERQVQTALRRLADPAIRANAIARATATIYNPAAREAAIREIDASIAREREAQTARLAELAQRRSGLTGNRGATPPAAQPQQQAPVQGAPGVAPPSGEVVPPPARPVPQAQPQASGVNPAAVPQDALARAQARRNALRADGVNAEVVVSNQSGRPVVRLPDGTIERF